ncbi:MAG: transglycosylase SLT domain-containing protein [Gammaproteobacteria bacterium]|nr:transglycosylase SLT domain-containing protein [Gammaproteobacteria bacterium]
MASKEEDNKLELDNLDDLDDLDFDFDDLDLGIDPPADDRSPVKRVSAGFVKGAAEELGNTGDLSRKLKKVLPEEYTSSIDLVDDAINTGKSLYDTVAKETSEGIKSIKSLGRRVSGKYGGKLPKGIREKLDKVLAAEEDGYKSPSPDDIRNTEITNNLATIFELQAQQSMQEGDERRTETALNQAIGEKRHKTELSALRSIAQSVKKQVVYQDQITARYQRKSLELQYRQLFATKDIIAITEKTSVDTKEALSSIVKNTSLPEYRKIELTEAASQSMRDKLLGTVQGKIQEHFRGFFGRARENLTNKVKDKARSIGDTMTSFSGMADQMMDIGEMAGGMVDPYESGGSMAGSLGVNAGLDKISPNIRNLLNKNEGIAKWGNKLTTAVGNAPRAMNEWARQDHGTGIIGSAKNFLAESLGTARLDPNIQGENIMDSDKPAIYDKLTRRSIVEIIPGYLSRIHQELQSVRSGMGFEVGEGSRVSFNLKSGRFDSQEGIKSFLIKDIFSEGNLNRASNGLDSVIDALDPQKKLSEEARTALGGQLLREYFDGRKFDITRFANPDSYDDEVPDDIAKELASTLSKQFNVTETVDDKGNVVRKFEETLANLSSVSQASRKFNSLGEEVVDPTSKIEAYNQLGYTSALETLGLTFKASNGKTQINYDKIFEIYQNGYYEGMPVQQAVEEIVRQKAAEELTSEEFSKVVEEESQGNVKAPKDGFFSKLKSKLKKGYDATTDKISPYYQDAKKSEIAAKASELYGIGKTNTSSAMDSVKGVTKEDLLSVKKTVEETFTKENLDKFVSDVKAGTKDKTDTLTDYAKGSGVDFDDIKQRAKEGSQGVRGRSADIFDNLRSLFKRVSPDDTLGTSGTGDINSLSSDTTSSYDNGLGRQEDIEGIGLNTGLHKPDLYSKIVGILTAEEEGVGQDVRRLVDLTESSAPEAQEAQVAMLSGILSNVEAIAAMMAEGDKESWFNIKDIGKKTGRLMSKVGGSFGSFYLGGLKMFGGGFAGAGKLLSGMGGALGRKLFGKSTKGSEALTDIYLEGTDEAVMTAKGMKNGEYFDSVTGEAITDIDKLKSLQGDVLDKAGNLVATTHELSRGIYDRFGKAIGGTGFFSKLSGVGSNLMSMVTAPWAMTGNLASGAASKLSKFASDVINRLQDVYVVGEDKPRILATVMKNGGYVSSTTNRPIYKLDQIDGDVLDRKGNVVLSLDDMALGLVNKHGEPLDFFKRQISRLIKLVKMPLKLGKAGINKIRSIASGAGKLAKSKFSKVSEGSSELDVIHAATSDRQLTVLEEIRDILLDRFPPRSKFDASGDGLRDGSWRAQMKENKDSEEPDDKEKTGPVDGILGKLKAGGAGLLGLLGLGGSKDSESKEEGGGMSISDAWAAGEMLKWGKDKLGKGAKKLGRGVKGLGKGLLGGAGWLGKKVAGRAVMAAGAKAAGVAAGLVSLPVLLGAAAVGAVAIGGYFLYKKLTERKLGDLGKLRMMQYGINHEDKDQLAKIYFLEDKLFKLTVVKDGEVKLDLKSIDNTELAKGFGVDVENRSHVENFSNWFVNRFSPIFLAHAGGIKSQEGNFELKDVDDKLTVSQKQALLDWARRTSEFQTGEAHPYSYLATPFKPEGVLRVRETDIEDFIKVIADKLEQEGLKGESDTVGKVKNAKPITKPKVGDEPKETTPPSSIKNGGPLPKSTKPVELSQQGSRSGLDSFIMDQNSNASGVLNSAGTFKNKGGGSGGDINDLPLPFADGSWSAMKDLIVGASDMAGVDPGVMATMAAMSSKFNSKATSTGTGAKGLYQFDDNEWKGLISRHGAKYGIGEDTSQYDPRANALMAAEYIKENSKGLEGAVKDRPITDTDLYMTNLLGKGSARTLLGSNPGDDATKVLPDQARSNPDLFYKNGAPKTVAEVYETMDRKVTAIRDHFAQEARDYTPVKPKAAEQRDKDKLEQQTKQEAKASLDVLKQTSNVNAVPEMSSAIKGNASSLNELKERRMFDAASKDFEAQRANEEMTGGMTKLVDILGKSLKTQITMEQHLWEINETLKNNSVSSDKTKGSQQPTSKANLRKASRGAPQEIPKSTVDLSRKTAM